MKRKITKGEAKTTKVHEILDAVKTEQAMWEKKEQQRQGNFKDEMEQQQKKEERENP